MNFHRFLFITGVSALGLLTGCATPPPAYDYAAFLKARPATLLVLPPVNRSPDIKGTPGVWAHAAKPLAEAGYYVLPATLVDETLRQNGVHTPEDALAISSTKLREVFGADAAVHLTVEQYGTSYMVIASSTTVVVEARIVDLRTGALLWTGRAAASADEGGNSGGGLVGMLITAVVNQVANTLSDRSFAVAAVADERLLSANSQNGVLHGPRSPQYGKPPGSTK